VGNRKALSGPPGYRPGRAGIMPTVGPR